MIVFNVLNFPLIQMELDRSADPPPALWVATTKSSVNKWVRTALNLGLAYLLSRCMIHPSAVPMQSFPHLPSGTSVVPTSKTNSENVHWLFPIDLLLLNVARNALFSLSVICKVGCTLVRLTPLTC